MLKQKKCYFKFCRGCGKKFQPKGKYQKFCDDCIFRRKNMWRLRLPQLNPQLKIRLLEKTQSL